MRKTCDTPGTRERISDTSKLFTGIIQALDTNADPVVVGDDNIVAAEEYCNAPTLAPGESRYYQGVDLHELWIDVRTANDGIATD